jgi:hypothetical protein
MKTANKWLNGGPHFEDGVCMRCGKPLSKTVWLEANNLTGTYHTPDPSHTNGEGEVPLKDSGGNYPFGPDCAAYLVSINKL